MNLRHDPPNPASLVVRIIDISLYYFFWKLFS
jgi:hypothetical protein